MRLNAPKSFARTWLQKASSDCHCELPLFAFQSTRITRGERGNLPFKEPQPKAAAGDEPQPYEKLIPEGLVPLSNRREGLSIHAFLELSFNAPKGWYHVLAATARGNFTIIFNIPAVLAVNCPSERSLEGHTPPFSHKKHLGVLAFSFLQR